MGRPGASYDMGSFLPADDYDSKTCTWWPDIAHSYLVNLVFSLHVLPWVVCPGSQAGRISASVQSDWACLSWLALYGPVFPDGRGRGHPFKSLRRAYRLRFSLGFRQIEQILKKHPCGRDRLYRLGSVEVRQGLSARCNDLWNETRFTGSCNAWFWWTRRGGHRSVLDLIGAYGDKFRTNLCASGGGIGLFFECAGR